MSYTSPNVPASGATFAQSRGGAAALLDLIVAQLLVPTLDPTTAPTVAVTGGGASGGLLAAGVYFLSYSETNGIGETLPKETAASFTVGATNIPRATFPALGTGNTARLVYLTAPGGASGTGTLYATGVTGTTFDLAAAAPTDTRAAVAQPAANSTGLSAKKVQSIRAAHNGALDAVWRDVSRLFAEFHRGEPVSLADFRSALRRGHVTFAALAKVCADIGALADANPGTFAAVATGIGGARTKRQWP